MAFSQGPPGADWQNQYKLYDMRWQNQSQGREFVWVIISSVICRSPACRKWAIIWALSYMSWWSWTLKMKAQGSSSLSLAVLKWSICWLCSECRWSYMFIRDHCISHKTWWDTCGPICDVTLCSGALFCALPGWTCWNSSADQCWGKLL